MKNRAFVFSVLFLFGYYTIQGQAKLVEKITRKGEELVIPYEKYVLPNGLTLIVHEDHSDPIAHVDVTYHVGSAREELGKSGFAHFFEHMLFQGSDHVGDDEHFKIVQEAGGTLNGSTTRDRTNYYQTIPVNQLEKILWLEADRMGFFLDAVTQRKFEIQRSTVKNERGENYDNVPYGQRFENINKNLYPYGHPYSWLTIGYVEDLNRVDVNDLKNFFLRWYGPNNATITVGGDVKTLEVVKLVEKYFGSIHRGPEVVPPKVPDPVVPANRYVSYVDNYAKLPMLNIAYPAVPDIHQDKAALACLAQVIGQGRNSILFQQLVKKQQALQASAFSNPSELAGEFQVVLIPYAGKSLKEIEDLYYASLDSFEARGITEEDLEKFKGGYESQIINSLQSVSGKVTQLARFQYLTGNPNQIASTLHSYTSLTREDVMNAFHKYIRNKGAVVLSILPKGQENLVAREDNYTIDSSHYERPDYGYEGLAYVKGKDEFDRSKMPGAGVAPVVKVPKFWRKDLANGSKLIGTENSEVPVVTITIKIPGGHLLQSSDLKKAGLANYFALMMNEDTKNHTAEQLTAELQKLGSSLSVYSELDGITFSVQSLKRNLDQTLALLQERIFQPNFTQASFDRIKSQKLQVFKAQKGQAGTVADKIFAKLNFGPDHIMGVSALGTEETIRNMTLADIQFYYEKYMTSLDTKVVIVGDISQKEILPRLGFLDKLPRKKISLPKIDPAPVAGKTKVFMVDVPRSAQSEIRIGDVTGLKYDATGNYYKASLANFALGGNFNSRVNMNLREDKGWTYGARTYMIGDEYTGTFEFQTGVRVDASDSAVFETMKEIRNYVQSGPTDADIAFIKSAISQGDARKYETGFQKAAFIGKILDYNLPPNYVEQQIKILQKITKEELEQVMKNYVHPDKLKILLVGDKEKIMEGVKKLGYEVVELDTEGNPVGKKAF